MDALATIIGQLLVGWLIADLLGGVAHWLEDRVLSVDTPILGRLIVRPNRLHHDQPMAFLQGGFLDRNLTTFAAAGAVSLLWLWILGPSLIWATATLGGAVSSMVHAGTHRPPSGNRVVRTLQEIGLLQSAVHHAGHHRPPSDRRYCPLTNWVNPALDAMAVWHRIERTLLRLGVPLADTGR